MKTAKIKCPDCHRFYDVDPGFLGRRVICANKACGTKFLAERYQPTKSDEEVTVETVEDPSTKEQNREPGSRLRPPSPNGASQAAQDILPGKAVDHETQLYRRRMLFLGGLAAIPGVAVLIVILVWLFFRADDYFKKQAMENAFRKEARVYLAKARTAVAAWPDAPDTLVSSNRELMQDFERIQEVYSDLTLRDKVGLLRSIGTNLMFASVFVERRAFREDEIREDLHSTNKITREFAEKRKADFEEELLRMNSDISTTSALIEAAEREFFK